MNRLLVVAATTLLAASCGSSWEEGHVDLTIPYDDERAVSATVAIDQGTSDDDTDVLLSVHPLLDVREPQPPPEIACALTTNREIDPLVFVTFDFHLRAGRYATDDANVLRLSVAPCAALATCMVRFAVSCETVRHDSVEAAADVVMQVSVTAENPSLGEGSIRVEVE